MLRIEIIGNLVKTGSWDNPQRGLVYSVDGIIGCLNGLEFRANQPKILEIDEK